MEAKFQTLGCAALRDWSVKLIHNIVQGYRRRFQFWSGQDLTGALLRRATCQTRNQRGLRSIILVRQRHCNKALEMLVGFEDVRSHPKQPIPLSNFLTCYRQNLTCQDSRITESRWPQNQLICGQLTQPLVQLSRVCSCAEVQHE